MKPDFTDDVSGTIVGSIKISAYVSYDGRKQGTTIYADSEEEAKKTANNYIKSLREENGEFLFNQIWPEKAWRLNFV